MIKVIGEAGSIDFDWLSEDWSPASNTIMVDKQGYSVNGVTIG